MLLYLSQTRPPSVFSQLLVSAKREELIKAICKSQKHRRNPYLFTHYMDRLLSLCETKENALKDLAIARPDQATDTDPVSVMGAKIMEMGL